MGPRKLSSSCDPVGTLPLKEVPVPQVRNEVVTIDRVVEVPVPVERIVTVEKLIETPAWAIALAVCGRGAAQLIAGTSSGFTSCCANRHSA